MGTIKKDVYDFEEAQKEYDKQPKPTLAERFENRPCVLILVFIVFIVYGLVSVTFDWLWVYDTINVQKALVFGPTGTGVTATLIVIASVGTISFGFEILNFSEKVYHGREILREDVAQLLSLFLSEVPQITLNVLLSACREVPTSYYQLFKAATAMIGAGLRALMMLYTYLTPWKNARRRGIVPFILRTIVLAACIYNCIGASLVWVFTYTSPADDSTGLRPPDTIVNKFYDGGRYFYKSGIYITFPEMNHCDGNDATTGWKQHQHNWIKMFSIYDVLDNPEESIAIFSYNDKEMNLKVSSEEKEICYRLNYEFDECSVELLDCSFINYPPDNKYIEYRFQNIDRSKTLVFGDIQYDAIYRADKCETLTSDDLGFVTDDTGDEYGARLQYFQVFGEVNDTMSFVMDYKAEPDGDMFYRFYHYDDPQTAVLHFAQAFDLGPKHHTDVRDDIENDHELNNITEVWSTGYFGCDMSGSLRPNAGLDSGFDCDNDS